MSIPNHAGSASSFYGEAAQCRHRARRQRGTAAQQIAADARHRPRQRRHHGLGGDLLGLGPQFSATLPLAFQLLLAGNMLSTCARNFEYFRVSQLGLFLFLPFRRAVEQRHHFQQRRPDLGAARPDRRHPVHRRAQPVVGWFAAWVILTALSGARRLVSGRSDVHAEADRAGTRTTIVFFALNFIAFSSIIYMPCCAFPSA
jgi:hypothetical protein